MSAGAGFTVEQKPKNSKHVDFLVRCWSCGKLLAEKVSRPWRIKCGKCKTVNTR